MTKNAKKILLVLLGLFIVTCSTYVVFAQKSNPQTINRSFKEVYNLAEPSVLYFYGEDCKYCVEFSPIFKKIAELYKGKYHFVKIDVDDSKNSALCYKFQIQTIPALFIYEPRKKLVHPIHPYYFSESGMRNILDNYLAERWQK